MRKEYALEVVDHVAYEIKMFLFCISVLIKREKENTPRDNFNNVLVVSFAVHFRNLYSFFMTTFNPKYPSDVDNVYFSDIKGSKLTANENIDEERKKANKKIAHIDRSRTELKKEGWDYRKLYYVFKTPILDFINDPEILPYIAEIALISEVKNYCDFIDCFLNDLESKGLVVNKVDTTSGSISDTSSTIQG